MALDILRPLVDRGALLALLRQDDLVTATEDLGAHRYDVDLANRTLVFTADADPTRVISTRTHLVASIAPGPRSVLWGWVHPQGEPDGPAARLRDAGAALGITGLDAGELPFPDDTGPDLSEWIAAAAHDIGIAAVEATGLAPYYSAPTEGGTRIVFLLETDLAPLTFTSAFIRLPRLLAGGLIRDPRTAIWSLARHRGWALEWTDEQFGGATMTDGVSSATFTFDENGQPIEVDGDLSGPGRAV